MVFVREHIKNHPKAGWQDVVKLCYQASFGAEHVMADVSAAEAYFGLEYSQLNAGDPPLFEMISEDVCRVDMRSETIKKKLADFDQKNEYILEQIEIEKQKQKKAQKIMWLVKYEYHS